MPTKAERIIRAVHETPWAILPSKLEQILELLDLRANGVQLTKDEVRARIGTPRKLAQRRVNGGRGSVAVLPLFGVLSQRMDMFTEMSGGTSTERFGALFDRAVADPDIGSIVMEVDSPGGSVSGVEELSAKIFNARGAKPIIAVANTLAASAAFYVATAADEMVVAPSAEVGSVGVFSVHTDISGADQQRGIRRTIIKAGRLKAAGNPLEPLSDEARAVIQENVDEFFSLFIEALARNRGVSTERVRTGFGEGRVLPARMAVQAGMADRIATLEDVLVELGVDRDRLAAARAEEERPDVEAQVTLGLNDPSTTVVLDAETVSPITTIADRDRGPAAKEEKTAEDQPAPEAKESAMSDQDKAAQNGAAENSGGATVAVQEQDAVAAERKRTREITEMCAMHEMSDRAAAWIEAGWSADRVGREILRIKGEGTKPVMPQAQKAVDLSPKEERRYSVVRALNACVSGDWSKAGFEREVSQAVSEKVPSRNRDSSGHQFSFFVPTALSALPKDFRGVDAETGKRAALDTATPNAGQELVFTEPGSFIDMLRTRMVTRRLGATFLPGLEGNVSFPKQTGPGTLSWRAENPGSDVALSDLATDQVQLTPNDATSATSFSRRLLAQSVINVEQLVRQDLAAIAARGLDFAALHGGGGNEPTGIYNATGVNSTAFGGATVDWPNIVGMETQVAADDADIGVMAYATTPEVRGSAKTTEKATGTAQFIWTGGVEDGEMNGFRAMASNQFLKNLGAGTNEHGIIFGVWSQLLIGEWGALELLVDPFSLSRQGLVVVVMFMIADVAIRHEEAFTIGTGLIPA